MLLRNRSMILLLLTLIIWTVHGQTNYPTQYGDQYNNQRNSQYGNNSPPYANNQYNNNPYNQQPFGNNGSNQPPYNNYNNQSPYNNGNNQPPFGNNGNQYGNNGQFGNSGQFGSNGQFGNNGQYGNNGQFGNNAQSSNNGQISSDRQFNTGQFGNNNNNQFPGPSYQADDGKCCEEYCYATDEDPYIYFGTKTAYDSLNIRQGSQHVVPDCTPVQIWVLIRQSTNIPKAEKIMALRNLNRIHDEIARNYEERKSYPDRGRLCAQDYDIFRKWRWNETISENKADMLTTEGVEDLKQLARRIKSKFSQILSIPYDERSFYFQYTNFDKTHDSYQAFIEGLFGSDSFRVHANVMNDELLTRADANCRVWNQQYDQNQGYQNQGYRNQGYQNQGFQNQGYQNQGYQNQGYQNQGYMTKREFDKFMEKPDYQQMVRDVFRRLGFRYSLNASIIHDIYDLCRYEKAWYVQQRSPWCVAFTKTHLKLLEYAEDLKSYYKSGYGNPVSSRIGCGPIKDFYDRFEKTINGNNEGNKGNFLFTHSSTFEAFLTAMGLGKDYSPITADNYYQQSKRNWKTSLLDPFTANFEAVLYQCRSSEKHKVLFFLNEQPVDFPECSVGLCNWSIVQQKFEQISRSCNINDICNENSASGLHLSITAALLPFLIYLRL